MWVVCMVGTVVQEVPDQVGIDLLTSEILYCI